MVQYTNILIASAVAAAVPALSAPFAYLESREIVNINAREPMFKAATELLKTGASRRVITGPLQEKVKDAYNADPIRSGPGPFGHKNDEGHASGHSSGTQSHYAGTDALREGIHFSHVPPPPPSKILTELARHNANHRRSIEYLETREPMFKAATELLKTGASRRVITGPLQEKVKDAYNADPIRSGPGPFGHKNDEGQSSSSGHASGVHHSPGTDALREGIHFSHVPPPPPSKILAEVAKHNANHPRSLEYLDTREPMFKAATELLKTGASRRVITGPLQEKVKDAYNADPIRSGPGPFTHKSDGGHASGHSSGTQSHYAGTDALREGIHFSHAPPSKILTELRHNANHRRSIEYLDIRELEDLLERDSFYLD